MFVHTVLFWIASEAPPETFAAMEKECHEMLSKIPSVRHLWTGKPVPSPRPVVDSSYSLGLNVIYDDAAGHDLYQPHELHQAFIAKYKQYWAKVQIYDFA